MLHSAVHAAESTADLVNISLPNAVIVAVLGYAVVFAGLIVLMLVVIAIGKAFSAKAKKATVEEPTPVAAPAPAAPAAPGSAGELKLYNVEPKTAAMLMAIVADKMGKPLNELRFLSIREVE